MFIKRDDFVVVIAGDDAGKQPRKVLRVLRADGKVVVEGVNRVYKHVKPGRRNPQGGRLSKEMAIDASNVQLYCDCCERAVKVGSRFIEGRAKERFCRKCGQSLGRIAPARVKAVQA